jgi:VanZ family protein
VILLFVLPYIAGLAGMFHLTLPFIKMEVSQVFLSGLVSNCDLLISTSLVARIISFRIRDLSHCT